eukprot:1159277-Pelagomonas_calceolata.AAC.6
MGDTSPILPRSSMWAVQLPPPFLRFHLTLGHGRPSAYKPIPAHHQLISTCSSPPALQQLAQGRTCLPPSNQPAHEVLPPTNLLCANTQPSET